MKTIKLGVVGFAHMHILDQIRSFVQYGAPYTFVSCADLPPETPSLCDKVSTRARNLAEALRLCEGMRDLGDWQRVLDSEIDVLLVACENNRHARVAEAALRRGIWVILEKPMALSYADALTMARAAKAGGARLITNWPTTWAPSIRTAWQWAAAGDVGRILRFSYRNPESLGPFSYGQGLTEPEMAAEWWYHPSAGGGAMADYLGYGLHLSRWFFHHAAESAFVLANNFISPFSECDDHAAMLLRYPGALAELSGTWSTRAAGALPSGPIVYGTLGTIVTGRLTGKVELFTERHCDTPVRSAQPDALPAGRDSLAAETLHCLHTGELHETLDIPVNLDAVAAYEAGARSVRSGQLEPVYTEALS